MFVNLCGNMKAIKISECAELVLKIRPRLPARWPGLDSFVDPIFGFSLSILSFTENK